MTSKRTEMNFANTTNDLANQPYTFCSILMTSEMYMGSKTQLAALPSVSVMTLKVSCRDTEGKAATYSSA